MPKSKVSTGNVVKLDLTQDKKKKAKESSKSGTKGSSSSSSSRGSTPKGAKKPRTNLKPLREQLEILVSEANRRVNELTTAGLPQSRAMEEAARTAIRFHRDESNEIVNMFTSDLHRMTDIAREFARVQRFLSDETSTIGGAKREKDDIQTGLFGGQYRAMYGTGYDITRVSKEEGDLALEVYHKVLEFGGGWEAVISHLRATNMGLTQYDSEQLIQEIYDMITSGMYDNDDSDDLAARAYARVREIIKFNDQMAERQRLGINYGILPSELDAEKYDRYVWREEKRKMKENLRK